MRKEQYQVLASNLRYLRLRRNVKASYAAKKMGIKENRLYSWEAGRTAPNTPDLYMALSDFYGIPVDALIRGDIKEFDFAAERRKQQAEGL